MTAPASCNSAAASSTAAATAGCKGRPTPASIISPIRKPFRSRSRSRQGRSVGGRLMWSRASGCESTCISRAESSTVRVIGPGHPADEWRIDRHAAVAWLQREDPAPAGRQPHRTADVRAQVQRAIAGCGRSAGAGAGAARGARQVPGIARQLVEARQPRRQHPVVRIGGLAEDQRPGLAHPRRRRGIDRLRGHVLPQPNPPAWARPGWRSAP